MNECKSLISEQLVLDIVGAYSNCDLGLKDKKNNIYNLYSMTADQKQFCINKNKPKKHLY